MDYRVFNVRTRSFVCVRIHTGGLDESDNLFWLGKTHSFSCAPDGIRTLDLWFSMQSNALTTEPTRHPLMKMLEESLDESSCTDWVLSFLCGSFVSDTICVITLNFYFFHAFGGAVVYHHFLYMSVSGACFAMIIIMTFAVDWTLKTNYLPIYLFQALEERVSTWAAFRRNWCTEQPFWVSFNWTLLRQYLFF